MGWLMLFAIGVLGLTAWVAWQLRQGSSQHRTPAPWAAPGPRPSPPPPRDFMVEAQCEVEAEMQRLLPELEAQVEAEAARLRTEVDREVARELAADDAQSWVDLEELDTAPEPSVTRSDFVPKDKEAPYLTRDAEGLPTLRLVDAGDRLAIWSPVGSGALINPKGPDLRGLGLYSSYARGSDHYCSAFRAADLAKGCWVDLRREPDNPHDKNAVALTAPGSSVTFGYVQKGRSPAVARRMDAGEDMAAVSMRGPGRGQVDESAFLLIGCRADLEVMLQVIG